MNSQDPIQMPGPRQLLTAFTLLVLIILALDLALQLLHVPLHPQVFVAPELLFPIQWLTVLF